MPTGDFEPEKVNKAMVGKFVSPQWIIMGTNSHTQSIPINPISAESKPSKSPKKQSVRRNFNSKDLIKKLEFYFDKGLNVHLTGKKGIGKTIIITEVFNRKCKKWLYFSGATLDPFCDFVGVPKESINSKGEPVLTFIRPEYMTEDVEAIFLDEYNRCLGGNTLIRLADGTTQKVKDLINKSHFYVYAFNHSTKRICIAKAHSARVTIPNADTIKITLDNGSIIECTEDHPFLLKTGEYKKASSLTIEDSLMTLKKFLNLYNAKKSGNHRIISIKKGKKQNVYDITVDEHENFALANGVFVHNSPKKVRNAVMELVQLKSINGRKFPNLKCVWVGTNPYNPDDDENEIYDVEPLDPAQQDRFQIQIDIPYAIDVDYFEKKFGKKWMEGASEWWWGLSAKLRDSVSPRRLDYALEIFKMQGDIFDVLPLQTNPSKLIACLQRGGIEKIVDGILEKKDIKEAQNFLKSENNYQALTGLLGENHNMANFFTPLLDEERQISLFFANDKFQKYIFANSLRYKSMLEQVVKNTLCNKDLREYINRELKRLAGMVLHNNTYQWDEKMDQALKDYVDKGWKNGMNNDAYNADLKGKELYIINKEKETNPLWGTISGFFTPVKTENTEKNPEDIKYGNMVKT